MLSLANNCVPLLCFQLPSTPCFYILHDQAVILPGGTSLLSFISDAAVFPNPSLLRDCGFDLLRHSGGGSHQEMAGCWPHQGTLWDRAAANAQRLQLGASLPQKKFTQSCSSSSVSGIMENHNTHLAPGFTPSDLVPALENVVVLPGPLGICLWEGVTQPLPGVFPARELALPMWPKDLQTSLCSWEFALLTRAPPGVELQSFRLCTPPVYSLNGI